MGKYDYKRSIKSLDSRPNSPSRMTVFDVTNGMWMSADVEKSGIHDWIERYREAYRRAEPYPPTFKTPRKRLQRKIGRTLSWSLLIIPSNRRHEIVGDFLESIHTARQQGVGRFGRWILIAAKLLLYSWCVLKLRLSDLVQPSEDTEAAEH